MLYTSFTKQKTSLNPTKMFALETSVFISRHYDYTQSSKHVMFFVSRQMIEGQPKSGL